MALLTLAGKLALLGKAAVGAIALATTGLGLIASGGTGIVENRLALWYVVHGLCVPNAQARHDPAPCLAVDLAHGESGGSVILKDRRGATQYLVIPTRRVTGIESPLLLEPDAPNYWRVAWEARKAMTPGRPSGPRRDIVGLAINSIEGRSQDQLHIHVDCIRRDVYYPLKAHIREIGTDWAPMSIALAGRRYEAMRVAAEDLSATDPFKLLAARMAAAKQDMGRETLAVVGVTFEGGKPGFVLLADRVDRATGNFAHSEDLLDHGCSLLKAPPLPAAAPE